jgi:hypothetical protein
VEHQSTVNQPTHARISWPILRGITLIVALCGLVGILHELLYGPFYGVGTAVFTLATFALIALTSAPKTPSAIKGEAGDRATPRRWPDWTLIVYCVFTGVGFNWACAFLWFSRKYGFFSAPVVGATALIFALYFAVAFLTACLTGGDWRKGVLVFAVVPVGLAAIVLRLGLLN